MITILLLKTLDKANETSCGKNWLFLLADNQIPLGGHILLDILTRVSEKEKGMHCGETNRADLVIKACPEPIPCDTAADHLEILEVHQNRGSMRRA